MNTPPPLAARPRLDITDHSSVIVNYGGTIDYVFSNSCECDIAWRWRSILGTCRRFGGTSIDSWEIS